MISWRFTAAMFAKQYSLTHIYKHKRFFLSFLFIVCSICFTRLGKAIFHKLFYLFKFFLFHLPGFGLALVFVLSFALSHFRQLKILHRERQ